MDAAVMTNELKWWMPEYGFFGKFYMEGDDSVEGYLEGRKQTLSERTEMEVKGVIDLLGLKANDKVMDCPCGYGRHSNGLSKRGIDVTGVDINPVHLGRAIENKRAGNLNTKFEIGNMIEIDYKDQFDGVINMFYSFGFFDTDEENFQVLKNFYDSLKKGGKFLMHTDVNIPRIMSRKYKFDEERKLNSGNMLRVIDDYNEETKRIDGRWIITHENGEVEDVDYSVRVYTREEFTDLCYQAGFTKVTAYSDWDGSEYSEDAEDMIIIAEK